MNKQSILLISIGKFEKNFPEIVAREVEREYKCPATIEEKHLDLNIFYDPVRRQYNANDLLREIDKLYSANHSKNIGLFNVDLFIPILTYIFGQAVFKGNTGVVSIYRLRNEHYGLKKDDDLLLERFKKVVIHELGHNFGLVHCLNPSCVMRSGTYVEDLDQKEATLCSKCRKELIAKQ